MAMSKAGSRPIIVGGAEYRWSFFQDSGYDAVTVQNVSGSGRKLAVQIFALPSVTPAFVAQSIEFALVSGWQADESGPPFTIRYEDRIFRVR